MARPSRLFRPVHVKDGPILETVEDATAFALSLPDPIAKRNEWQHVAALLMDPATPRDTRALVDQLDLALLLTGRPVFQAQKKGPRPVKGRGQV